MTSRDAVIDAIDGLYSASSGDGSWDTALDRVAAALNFSAAALTLFEGEYRPLKLVWRNIDDRVRTDYLAYYHLLDPCSMFTHPSDYLLTDYLFVAETEIDRSEYYAWKQETLGMRYHIGGRTASNLPFLGSLTLHRPKAQGHADEHDVSLFGHVFRHLELALLAEYRLGLSAAQSSLAAEVLESSRSGVIMLDRAGRTVFANRVARAMADLADGFTLGADGLTALRSQEDSVLKGLIARAVHDPGGLERRGGAMRLPRRSGKRDYAVVVSPFSVATPLFSGVMPAVVILLTDLDAAATIASTVLGQLYGLTPAEIRVAERLAAREKPTQIAEALAVGITTVREHLASLFRKTQTTGQTDLVRLLLSLPK